ncbi:MAG TPA: hypothetical protein VF062_11980 [Candidatus Limnocylindrales bacterium]
MIKRIAFVVVAALLTSTLVAAPAQAQTLVTCASQITLVEFSPGLTNTAQTVDVSIAGIFSCIVVEGGPPFEVAELDTTVEDVPALSCFTLLTGEEDATTLDWDDGEDSSHVEFALEAVVLAGTTVLNISGFVDDGVFEGADVQIDVEAVAPVTECLSQDGVTDAVGLGEMALIDLP